MSQSCVTTWPIDLLYGFIMFQYTTTQPTPFSSAFRELSSRFNSFASFYYPRLYYLCSTSPLFKCTNFKRILLCASAWHHTWIFIAFICVLLPFLHSFTATFPPLYNCTLLTMWFTFDYPSNSRSVFLRFPSYIYLCFILRSWPSFKSFNFILYAFSNHILGLFLNLFLL